MFAAQTRVWPLLYCFLSLKALPSLKHDMEVDISFPREDSGLNHRIFVFVSIAISSYLCIYIYILWLFAARKEIHVDGRNPAPDWCSSYLTVFTDGSVRVLYIPGSYFSPDFWTINSRISRSRPDVTYLIHIALVEDGGRRDRSVLPFRVSRVGSSDQPMGGTHRNL